MAMDTNTTFSDDEKRFLLAEMIKVSQTNVDALVQFVKTHAIGYKFWSIVVPQGRNLEQCVQAAENMLETKMPQSSLERASVSTASSGSPTKKPAVHATTSASTPSVAESFIVTAPVTSALHHGQFSPVPAPMRGPHVPIKPRPVSTNDMPTAPPASTPPEGPPVKKRRGRPPRRAIDYSLPPVAPKPIAPHITHSGGLLNSPQHPYAPSHAMNTAPFISASTPPTEGSLPGTPTHVSTPSSTNAQMAPGTATASGARGKKRSRQPAPETSGAEASEGNPGNGVGLHPSTSRIEAGPARLPQLKSPASTTNHIDAEPRTMTTPTEHLDARVPRYAPTDDRPLPIPSRGPTLAPLAGGEPSLPPSNSIKKDRPTPAAP